MALKRESAGLAGEDNNGQKRRLAQLLPFIKEMKLTLSLSVTTVKTEPVKEIVRFRCCRRWDSIQTASSVVVMSASHLESVCLYPII